MKKAVCIITLMILISFLAPLGADQAAYADHLFMNRKYPAAILEYERFLYDQAGNASDSLYALQGIVRAYYQAGLYDEMTDELRLSALLNRDLEFTVRYISLSELRRGRYEVASHVSDLQGGPNAMLLKGIAELYLDRSADAKSSFKALPGYRAEVFPWNKAELIRFCDQLDRLPKRSAWLAGSLALIPGVGYAYNGKWQTAIASLLLHAAFFASAWELRQNDLPISSAVVAMMGTAYYVGNIYGSVSETLKHNRQVRKNYLDTSLAPYFQYLEECSSAEALSKED
jgi:hypothetical protein